MKEITAPRLEGRVELPDGRSLGFSEFGDPSGRAVFWMHGTPGGPRQVPEAGRVWAAENGVRVIGVARPGIGLSTAHLYSHVIDFAADLGVLADRLGIEKMAVVGLSGGGAYTLAAAAGMPDRVVTVGVLGGVAPALGPDAVQGGLVDLAQRFRPVLPVVRVPGGMVLSAMAHLSSAVSMRLLELYRRVSVEGDRQILAEHDFRAMFIDDLQHGGRRQWSAPLADAALFTRHWGFAMADVKVPVRWWHGEHDNLVPFAHGLHMVERLPNAELITQPGGGHLAGLGAAVEVLATMLEVWDEPLRPAARQRAEAAGSA